jgi:1-acyl-sn-glycerol-3-phosphate acyltransferase
MNWLKNILGRLFAVYGFLLFTVTFLILFIPIWIANFIPDPQKTRYFLTLSRGWMAVYMPMIFCPVRRKGLEYFSPGQTYVVVSNHNSMVDIPVATPGVPGVNKTLSKKEMGDLPLFGVMYKVGGIMVDRKSEGSRRKCYEDMRKVLDMGIHMLLYPEGTRNRTNEPLKAFYDGAFALAIDAQKPIMPSLLFNTKKILPPGKLFFALPHAIEYHFLPPIPTVGMTKEDIPVLKEKVFKLMTDYYLAHQ